MLKLITVISIFALSFPAFAGHGAMGERHPRNVETLKMCLGAMDDQKLPVACLGVVNAQCDQGTYTPQCWAEEALAWNEILLERNQMALEYFKESVGEEFASNYYKAHEAWRISQQLDCQVALIEPYQSDGGETKCLAIKAVERLIFIEAVINGAEFDG